MIKKILSILTTFILVILPFLVGIPLSKHSPYVEGNSFKTYVIIWVVVSIAFATITIAVFKYRTKLGNRFIIDGLLLFLLLCPIAGIIGLAAPPDLSLKMLEHPEREHLRYIFLFIAAILFGAYSLFLLKGNSLKVNNLTKRIITVAVVLAIAEFIWEFTHHYLYPEAMNDWIEKGNSAEEFSKNYDNITIINIGVWGRLLQFSLIIWLSIHLYKLRLIKIWSPIINVIFSLLGIVAAIVIYVTHMNLPKGFEFLFLFFIPGIPFLILYWLGIGLLTQSQKSNTAS